VKAVKSGTVNLRSPYPEHERLASLVGRLVFLLFRCTKDRVTPKVPPYESVRTVQKIPSYKRISEKTV